MNKKLEILLLSLIIIFSFIVRLYRIDNPIADWHSWRQADTSAVSRNFVNEGFDLLHPKFDDLSNVPSGIDNPQGYRFVEFPIYNILQASLFNVFGTFSIEQWGRLVTIFASLGEAIFVYLIVKKHAGSVAAIFSAFFIGFIPYSIYYGRTILPDTSMAFAILGGIWFFDEFLTSTKTRSKVLYFILSLIFTIFAILLKPYALFFTIPMLFLAYRKYGFSAIGRWQLWFYLILSIAPFIMWRLWISQYPEGIPASSWLFNEGGIRFKGAFFYWLFADRIGRLILGYWGVILFVFGFLKIKKDQFAFFMSFIASSLLYMIVIARGNVQHDYYQILIVPTLAIFMGLGVDFLISFYKDILGKIKAFTILLVCIGFSLMFGWYVVRDYFNINNPSIMIAGNRVNEIVPKDAKIIALYDGDTSFLYQTQRKGWASLEKPLPEMIGMGADYLVIVNPTERDLFFSQDYKIQEKTPEYLIYNLHEKP